MFNNTYIFILFYPNLIAILVSHSQGYVASGGLSRSHSFLLFVQEGEIDVKVSF